MSAEDAAADSEAAEWGIEEGRRFARRMYLPRVAGLAFGALCVGGGLWEVGAPPWVWALLVLYTLVWPHFAYRLALRSRDPHRAELRNLMLDSAGGGVWIAAMHFSLAPSAVLVAMLAMDKAAVGGSRFLARCLAAQVAAAAAVALAAGIEPQLLQSGNVARVASLPLLLFYPVMVGLTAFRLARRVRHQNEELRMLSATDGLTGLPHHSSWEQAVEREFARARRYAQPAAVLMLDLDHFKAINDTHGHATGDAVLRAAAGVLRQLLRAQDVPGRYGGEEFGVILPGASRENGAMVAERLRTAIARAAEEPSVTVSIGAATFPLDGVQPEELIAAADEALYESKHAGRNRVTSSRRHQADLQI